MRKIYCKQTAKRLYYTEDIAVLSKDRVSETLEDYGDDQLECSETLKSSPFSSVSDTLSLDSTGTKLITLYEITNNEPNQIDLIGLDLEDDSYQEVYDYCHNKYENFEIIKL